MDWNYGNVMFCKIYPVNFLCNCGNDKLFSNTFNTELSYGSGGGDAPPVEVGASQRDMDYLTVINWVGALERIKPKSVHIYTIDRAPAFPYLQQVPAPRLREIAQRVRLAGLRCDVFGIPESDPGDAPAGKTGH